MGIKNLSKILKRYSPNYRSLIKITAIRDSTIAIDANLFIYRSVFAIRKGMGRDIEHTIKDKTYKVTHIYIMFLRLFGLKKMNITPIFVFDSSYSYLKVKTMEERKKIRRDMKERYLNAETDEEKKRYYHLSEDIKHNEYDDIIRLIELFGFPYIIAPEEADSQCAYLIKNNFVEYVVSDDMDLLTFGCDKIIRRFTTSTAKKMEVITLPSILSDLDIDMGSFIQLCILLGSDYGPTVPGIGPIKAYKIIKEHRTIESAQKAGVIPRSYNYRRILNYFVKTKHKKVNKSDIKAESIDVVEIKRFLIDKGFSDSNTINTHLDRLESLIQE